MKNQKYCLKHKLFVSLVLASFAITSFSPFFSNKVSAMSLNFEEKLPTKSKAAPSKEEVAKTMSNMPIQFEENRGQFDKKVRFASRRSNSTVFLTATEAVMTHKVSEKKNFALNMKLVNGNKDAKSFGSEEKVSKSNYFRGNDASKWQTDVSTFGRANYEEVYQGIDMAWYGNAENELEYDFIVKPNADYRQIELKFSGSKRLKIDKNGDLLIETKAGTITQRKPYTYQTLNGEKQEVESRYELVGKNKVKFTVGEYDKSKALVIDPALLKYATYFGGSSSENPYDMKVDSQGNLYLVGLTNSVDFPTTIGAFDTSLNGPTTNGINTNNAFVIKINNQNIIEYSTFLGGSNSTIGYAIDIDSTGSAFLSGTTAAVDFPTTQGAIDRSHNGFADVFVSKLSSTGSELLYSTYLGGTSSEWLTDMQIESDNTVRILGSTDSTQFPLTSNASSTTGGVFYAILNTTSAVLTYSTRIRGTFGNTARKLAIDSQGNSVLLGYTNDSTFPVTPNAYDTTLNGNFDLFIMKLSPAGTIMSSTFLGGSSDDGTTTNWNDISFDSSDNIYLVAGTISANFPRTPGALTRPLISSDSFLIKFDSALSTLLISTPLGPNDPIISPKFTIDLNGDLLIWGATFNTFPQNPECRSKFVIAKYASNGTTVKELKCFNSTNTSYRGIAVDSQNEIFVAASAGSFDIETTPNAFDRTRISQEGWFAKVKFIPQSIPNDFDADGKSDMAVYRNGMWHVNQSLWGYKAQPFGLATDTPVPADYDGDGKTDYAVFRPSDVSGQPDFYVMKSSTNTLSGVEWGSVGDTPVPADYDGDGKVDFAVYRMGEFGDFFMLHQTGTSRHYRFGVTGDKAVVADYDGDNKADFAVFRPSNGIWYVVNSATDTVNYLSWGEGTDKLVPADYDGDGKTDAAVFRASDQTWYVLQTSNGQMRAQQWGLATDKLVPGDYDGDGKTDIAVYRDGQWIILQSSNNAPSLTNFFGNSTDIPVESLAVR
jgi:FG-GAP-like repeat/Beta-propeller repeat